MPILEWVIDMKVVVLISKPLFVFVTHDTQSLRPTSLIKGAFLVGISLKRIVVRSFAPGKLYGLCAIDFGGDDLVLVLRLPYFEDELLCLTNPFWPVAPMIIEVRPSIAWVQGEWRIVNGCIAELCKASVKTKMRDRPYKALKTYFYNTCLACPMPS